MSETTMSDADIARDLERELRATDLRAKVATELAERYKRERDEAIALIAAKNEVLGIAYDQRDRYCEWWEATDAAWKEHGKTIVELTKAIKIKDEALCLASVYVLYVKEHNPALHKEADGTPSVEESIKAASKEVL